MVGRAAACIALALAVPSASAADVQLTGADMIALFQKTKVLKLGGSSSGYYGAIVLADDGKVSGALYEKGTLTSFSGTWRIVDDRFCHTYTGYEKSEICETWYYVTDTSVKTMIGPYEYSILSW